MSGLDIAAALVVLVGVWRGLQSGLVRTCVALLGWLLALIAGSRFAKMVAPLFTSWVDSPVLQKALGFLVVVIAVLLVVNVLGWSIASAVQKMRLSTLDRVGGAILGAAKNTLAVLVILSLAAPLLVQLPMWQRSILLPAMMPYAPMAKTLTYNVLGKTWQQIDPADSNSKQSN